MSPSPWTQTRLCPIRIVWFCASFLTFHNSDSSLGEVGCVRVAWNGMITMPVPQSVVLENVLQFFSFLAPLLFYFTLIRLLAEKIFPVLPGSQENRESLVPPACPFNIACLSTVHQTFETIVLASVFSWISLLLMLLDFFFWTIAMISKSQIPCFFYIFKCFETSVPFNVFEYSFLWINFFLPSMFVFPLFIFDHSLASYCISNVFVNPFPPPSRSTQFFLEILPI